MSRMARSSGFLQEATEGTEGGLFGVALRLAWVGVDG